VLQWMEDAGVRPTLYMYQSVLPYIWRDNSMDYVTLMQEKIIWTMLNLECLAWTLEARYKSSSSHVLKFLRLSCWQI